MSFSASVTTCDGEHARNSAYFVSVDRASSSSRSCKTVVFGCLGGAFRTGIETHSSFCSESFPSAYKIDCFSVCTRAKHGPEQLGVGGSDPRKFWAAEGRRKWGRSHPTRCFGRVQLFLVPLRICFICTNFALGPG